MTDLAAAVQIGSVTALAAGVTLAPVMSHVPEDFTYPFVLFSDDVITEVGAKDSRLERHEFSVSVVTQGESKLPLRAIQEQVRSSLHLQPITADGAIMSPPEQVGMNDSLLDDGQTYVGTQRFVTFVQPA